MGAEWTESKWKVYGYPLIALVIGIIAYYFIIDGNSITDVLPLDGCLVTEEWFEEAFGQPIADAGKNYVVIDGRICITNQTLLKEIYGMVEE